MELVQWQMQSIHGLAVHSPESNKSSRWSLMDLVQWQMQSIYGLTIHSPESNKSSRWLRALFAGLYCGLLNPSKSGQKEEKDFGGFGVVRVKE